MPAPPQLLTPSEMAKRLNQSVARINYILATRAHIQPAALAGRVRLYRDAALAHVRYELNLIDARRCTREAGFPQSEEARRA